MALVEVVVNTGHLAVAELALAVTAEAIQMVLVHLRMDIAPVDLLEVLA
jgi:hypothetical protein